MEYAMMDELVFTCKRQGIKEIYGYYYPTEKNAMVKELYAFLGFEKLTEDENGICTWKFIVKEDYQAKNKVIDINGAENE